ncbi:LysR family transcriptional regulator [Izhakiella australiensis]|uniref:LysR family transcriptional regulator n=1 Tax=Izhakiella australiensis TaxID=1926881 RepID=A0A1S8YKK1_9GAMM|nr:LysR family transcriptional regulator [Izhakiella australiensis]OON39462.1 LysR family transcriptional regulator [Izhakiella australiensis]
MDRVDLFRIFVQAVQSNSFTRAASVMNMPRSSVSAAIAELETRVGVRLFHRTTRSISLTSHGCAFYELCQNAISAVEEAENMFKNDGAQASGNIKIDVPGRVGRLIISPALPDFFRQYPLISLDMGMSDRNVNLAEEGIDCALRVGVLANSSLVARKLGYLPLINVASPGYISKYGMPDSPDALSRHFMVSYASPTTGRVERWEWHEDGHAHFIAMQSLITVNNAEAYISCCLAGMGIIQIPQYDVQQHLDCGELVEILPDYLPAALPVSLLYPHRKHISQSLLLFIGWVEPLIKEKMHLN